MIYERIRYYHAPRVLLNILMGKPVETFDFRYSARKMWWLRTLIHKGYVKCIYPLSSHPGHGEAIDLTEKMWANNGPLDPLWKKALLWHNFKKVCRKDAIPDSTAIEKLKYLIALIAYPILHIGRKPKHKTHYKNAFSVDNSYHLKKARKIGLDDAVIVRPCRPRCSVKTALRAIALVPSAVFQPVWMLHAKLVWVMACVKWEYLFSKLQFRNYIYCNKEGITQVADNIILRRKGVIVWDYLTFLGGSYLYATDKEDFINHRNINWCYLNPTYRLMWNHLAIEYNKLHHQYVDKYYAVGVL